VIERTIFIAPQHHLAVIERTISIAQQHHLAVIERTIFMHQHSTIYGEARNSQQYTQVQKKSC
jgi:hypothetical protein